MKKIGILSSAESENVLKFNFVECFDFTFGRFFNQSKKALKKVL
jgi:hypothetical protein